MTFTRLLSCYLVALWVCEDHLLARIFLQLTPKKLFLKGLIPWTLIVSYYHNNRILFWAGQCSRFKQALNYIQQFFGDGYLANVIF